MLLDLFVDAVEAAPLHGKDHVHGVSVGKGHVLGVLGVSFPGKSVEKKNLM